jgi:hypothetical protein
MNYANVWCPRPVMKYTKAIPTVGYKSSNGKLVVVLAKKYAKVE